MAVVKTHTVTSYTLTDVKRGDVFQWLQDSGCYKKDNVMVVQALPNKGNDLQFLSPSSVNAYGSVEWLEREMNAGTVVYIGNVSKLKFAE